MVKAILFTNISSQDSDDTDSAGAGLVRVCLLLRAQSGLGGPGLKWTARPRIQLQGGHQHHHRARGGFLCM